MFWKTFFCKNDVLKKRCCAKTMFWNILHVLKQVFEKKTRFQKPVWSNFTWNLHVLKQVFEISFLKTGTKTCTKTGYKNLFEAILHVLKQVFEKKRDFKNLFEAILHVLKQVFEISFLKTGTKTCTKTGFWKQVLHVQKPV